MILSRSLLSLSSSSLRVSLSFSRTFSSLSSSSSYHEFFSSFSHLKLSLISPSSLVHSSPSTSSSSSSSRPPTVLTVEMNRPEVHNAFNQSLIAELARAFSCLPPTRPLSSSPPSSSSFSTSSSSLPSLSHVRAVLLRSSGPSFSSGADLSYMKQMKSFSLAENQQDAEKLFTMVDSIFTCPVPVLARVHGPTLGGGLGLLAACDFSFSLSSSFFALSEVKLGLAPAVISPFLLSKLSLSSVSRYFLTGERFSAAEAKEAGFISKVFEKEDEMDAALSAVLSEIVSASPQAVRQTKRLLRELQEKRGEGPHQIKEFVTSLIATLRISPEGQEGVTSFLEKRKPSWRA